MDLKKLTDQEINEYINSKINLRESEVISPLIVKYDKFIQPHSACMANIAKAHAFRMDCLDVYKTFLKFYRDQKFGTSNFDKIAAVEFFQNKYLGIERNDELRQQRNLSLPDLHSIKAYIGCAVCFERGVFAHNLLQLLGMKSSLITKNYHTYNLIDTGKNLILYDPTNPTIGSINGKLVPFASMCIISSKLQDKYLYGDIDFKMESSFYEMFYGAKDVRVPKLTYKGLSLPQKTSDNDDENDLK